MLIQQAMIDRVRQLCQSDERLVAGITYGSFALGEGDAFSDIEFVFFVRNDALPHLDRQAWVAQIEAVDLFFADDFGHYTAIFANLVRGEFHFEPASALNKIDSWRGNVFFPSLEGCVLVDRIGELTQRLAPLLLPAADRGADGRAATMQWMFANLMLFGASVLARGEVARSLEVLSLAHRYLLWQARLVEGKTEHWPTPSRSLETDISSAAYARYRACTAPADRAALASAYRNSWAWGQELSAALTPRYGESISASLAAKLTERVAALTSDSLQRTP